MNLRKSVAAFAELMESRLREFDLAHGGDSWRDPAKTPPHSSQLINRAERNLNKVRMVIGNALYHNQGVVQANDLRPKVADVANLLMMLLDVGKLLIYSENPGAVQEDRASLASNPTDVQGLQQALADARGTIVSQETANDGLKRALAALIENGASDLPTIRQARMAAYGDPDWASASQGTIVAPAHPLDVMSLGDDAEVFLSFGHHHPTEFIVSARNTWPDYAQEDPLVDAVAKDVLMAWVTEGQGDDGAILIKAAKGDPGAIPVTAIGWSGLGMKPQPSDLRVGYPKPEAAK